MTLVLSYANPEFTLQVSDRLVTQGTMRRDPTANKSIVLVTRNALVSLGYSGLAVVDKGGGKERVTDQWLVEQLVGHEVDPSISIGGPRYNFDLGYALKALCDALDSSRFFRGKHQIEIAFCGFQWKLRKLALHLSGTIQHTGSRYVAKQDVHRTSEGLRLELSMAPDTGLIDGKQLLDELYELGPDTDAAEALLVDTMTSGARESRVVGADCLSVLIKDARVRVRYHGTRPPVGPAGTPGTPTPWIVSPLGIHAPTVTVSGGVRIGGLHVEVDAPPLDHESFVLKRSINPATGRVRTTAIIGATQMLRRPWGPHVDVPPPPLDD